MRDTRKEGHHHAQGYSSRPTHPRATGGPHKSYVICLSLRTLPVFVSKCKKIFIPTSIPVFSLPTNPWSKHNCTGAFVSSGLISVV